MKTAIVWYIRDLRIDQNPALHAAVKEFDRIIPVYILFEELGGASKWWLHHSLEALSSDYQKKGGKLILREGNPLTILKEIAQKSGASAVFLNRLWDPPYVEKIEKIQKTGLEARIYNGNYLIDPREMPTYQVFTPFYNACLKTMDLDDPLTKERSLATAHNLPSLSLKELKLIPKLAWVKKLDLYWKPGREEALKSLKCFASKKIGGYSKNRDLPSVEGTSRLSAHLHFGEISPLEIWHAAKGHASFQRQLIWREFCSAFLTHFPKVLTENWRAKFDRFPWNDSKSDLKKWQKGLTGYPIVDAGMRQLWETGWMHNRVRMIAASFLTKDLQIHWREGEKWFWDTLVDADKANNVIGWQWVAGSGPDAAPYFRIFNPVLQGEKFDPDGLYVRQFVPELKNLPSRYIHKPWEAPPEVLSKAGITLGKTYPKPMVDHAEARKIALAAFHKIL